MTLKAPWSGSNPPLMAKTSVLRYLGNILLIIGYQTMLWGDFRYGLLFKCIGGILTIPFAIKLKLYDVLILSGFFTVNEVAKLVHLFS
jgi:hypothetical protein